MVSTGLDVFDVVDTNLILKEEEILKEVLNDLHFEVKLQKKN